jgi:acetyl-CoA acetyltransferase family protein
MTNVVIASAARTPVGSFLGSFANTPAHELGRIVIEAVVERAGVDKSEVSETILGQVLTAAQGQNPARQAHINAGLPKESAAWGINQVCGSGLRAVALGAQHIMLGDADIVVAGGQENMSMSPHAAPLRQGQKMGDLKYIDTMIRDGLWDAFNGYHMGQTAENVAEQWQISRDMQDEFAVGSQNKAEAAQKAGKFADEITAVTIKTARATSSSTATSTSATAPPWRRCQAAPRLHQGRVRHRRQRLGPQRRRGRDAPDERRGRREARHRAAGAHRLLRDRRSRPVDHGRGPDLRLPQGAGKGGLEGR